MRPMRDQGSVTLGVHPTLSVLGIHTMGALLIILRVLMLQPIGRILRGHSHLRILLSKLTILSMLSQLYMLLSILLSKLTMLLTILTRLSIPVSMLLPKGLMHPLGIEGAMGAIDAVRQARHPNSSSGSPRHPLILSHQRLGLVRGEPQQQRQRHVHITPRDHVAE